MARKKQYDETEVIEKAMHLFWRNGYGNTSMRQLEKEMGINQFSIYSSFGSKEGVLVETVKMYISRYTVLVDKLKVSDKGIEAIREFFYDFMVFSADNDTYKGCLLANTAVEIGADSEGKIKQMREVFASGLRQAFISKLLDSGIGRMEEKANFLLVAKQALSNSSRFTDRHVIDDFIRITFQALSAG